METGFLTDDQGNPSSMRVMSVVALVASILFGLVPVVFPDYKDVSMYMHTTFLTAAFGPKVAQKWIEKRAAVEQVGEAVKGAVRKGTSRLGG